MKRLLLVATSLLPALIFAQNYVPNYSFETYVQCPNFYNQVSYCTGWFPSWNNNNPQYHTEYLNACGTSPFSVPANAWGNQQAATGQGYMATCTGAPSVMVDYRENIYTQLIAPLTVGQLYYVSFKISFTENSQYATNNVGAKFSTVPSFPINNSCQLAEPTVITDTQNWTTISGTFVADSAYGYICIGNFMTDANTLVVNACSSCQFPHRAYYIDDVCVWGDSENDPQSAEALSGNCAVPYSPQWISSTDVQTPDFSLFPNPASTGHSVTVLLKPGKPQSKNLHVVDMQGRTIFNQSIAQHQNQVELQTSTWESGIYFVILEGDDFAPVTRKLMVIR